MNQDGRDNIKNRWTLAKNKYYSSIIGKNFSWNEINCGFFRGNLMRVIQMGNIIDEH